MREISDWYLELGHWVCTLPKEDRLFLDTHMNELEKIMRAVELRAADKIARLEKELVDACADEALQMVRMNSLRQTVAAYKERVEQLEWQLAECREKLAVCDECARSQKKTIVQLGRELAAAEERERELRDALESLQHADGCYCDAAFAGPGQIRSHAPECERALMLLEARPDHAALAAMLEQVRAEATAQAFDVAAERVCDAEIDIDIGWDQETRFAWRNFGSWLDNRIQKEIKQARVEERERCAEVIHRWRTTPDGTSASSLERALREAVDEV